MRQPSFPLYMYYMYVLHVNTLHINDYITSEINLNGVTGYCGYILQLMFSAQHVHINGFVGILRANA